MSNANRYQSPSDYYMDSQITIPAVQLPTGQLSNSVARQPKLNSIFQRAMIQPTPMPLQWHASISVKAPREPRINSCFARRIMPHPNTCLAQSQAHDSTRRKDFYPAVPATTYSENAGASIYGCFDYKRLKQTAVADLLNGKIPPQEYQGVPHHSLADTLRSKVSPFGAISNSSGCLGSGILIGKNLLLVSRHSIAGHALDDMVVELGYLEQEGFKFRIKHIVEDNEKLDFAILDVEGEPGGIFKPASLSLEEHPFCEDLPLLHHPKGKSLQVSVHAFGPRQLSSRIITYHDTDYCSSGGGYLNHRGKVIAMHLGSEWYPRFGNLQRSAIPISEIVKRVPHGIIAKIADGSIPRDTLYHAAIPRFYLAPIESDFQLDEEGKFNQETLTAAMLKHPDSRIKVDTKGKVKTSDANLRRIERLYPTLYRNTVAQSLNRGGLHGFTSGYSLLLRVDSDHVPAYEVWEKTTNAKMQQIFKKAILAAPYGDRPGQNGLPAVTIPHDNHVDLLTTGKLKACVNFRARQINLCNRLQIYQAIEENLDDYQANGLFPAYKEGVKEMLDEHVKLTTLTDTDKDALVKKFKLT